VVAESRDVGRITPHRSRIQGDGAIMIRPGVQLPGPDGRAVRVMGGFCFAPASGRCLVLALCPRRRGSASTPWPKSRHRRESIPSRARFSANLHPPPARQASPSVVFATFPNAGGFLIRVIYLPRFVIPFR